MHITVLPWMLVVIFSYTPLDGDEAVFRSLIPMDSKFECIREKEKIQGFRVETPIGVIELDVECYPSTQTPDFDLNDLKQHRMKEV